MFLADPVFGLTDAVQLFNSQVQRSNNFWSAYSAVALGVIGLTIARAPDHLAGKLRSVLSIAFLIFAFQNCWALQETHGLLAQISLGIKMDVYKALVARDPQPSITWYYAWSLLDLHAVSPRDIRTYHHILDGAVLCAVWLPVLLPRVFRAIRKRWRSPPSQLEVWPE